jgi:very-short-patch-repair endonuclease/DNA polymerase III delta prime subunit
MFSANGASPQDTLALAIHGNIAAKINFACQQSSFAFLRDLRVENRDVESSLDDLRVTLRSNPEFLKQKSWRIDRIAPGEIVTLKDRDIELDGGFLLNLAESVQGTAHCTVEAGGRVVGEQSWPVELLAYNEWGGAGYMPELLAAFSMPNDPAPDSVLHDAVKALRKACKPDGIDGYKSGSRARVWELASAIYTAITNLGLGYTLPPSSFEQNGQKIRLPAQVLENRVATCLDTTMLFASVFEQAGLNPIVVLPHGHAFVGVWLQPEELSTIVIDEAETLRKRVQLNELLLIETTFVTRHPVLPFSKAVAAAVESIAPGNDETFNAAIDIRRARAHRIKPLALKSDRQSGTGASDDNPVVEQVMEEAPSLPDFTGDIEEEKQDETPAGRLERWQRKLLDLSTKNSLLNHKSSRSSLHLICPDVALLEDKLSGGIKISIRSVPRPGAQGQDEALHRQRTGESITSEYAREALNQAQILVDMGEEELSKQAVEIYRKARTALEEGGANTLYLALGFLLWKHRDLKDERRFRAPLILLPVTLERKSARSGFRLSSHDDEPRFNTTLLEMLRKDFDLEIRGFDGPLPTDESGIDVKGIWERIRREVRDVPGFEVVEEVVLGHFSFAKYLMWKDLVARTDELRKSQVVRHLIDSPRDPYPAKAPFVDLAELDREYAPSDLLTPLPADASQMAAIASADRGKDFIIIGPPGTGKSQTISNLIAHMLGKGKSVLFVSEKTAALEAVHRRLEKAGLGRFCLQLHSSKARKSDVLGQLHDTWQLRRKAAVDDWPKEAERLRQLRDQLNLVVDRLHLRRGNGLTAHYAIGVKVRDEAIAARVTFCWVSADRHDEKRLAGMREAVEKLRVHYAAIGNLAQTPFRLVSSGEWSPQWEGQLAEQAVRLATAASKVDKACAALLDGAGIALSDLTLERLDAVSEFASLLAESWRKQTSYALEADGQERIEALEEAVSRLKAYAEAQASLSCAYEPMAWRRLDGDDIARRWQEAESLWEPKGFFARRKLIKEMKAAGALGDPDPARDAAILKRLREDGEAIDRLDGTLSGFRAWKGHASDAEAVKAFEEIGKRTRSMVGRLVDDTTALLDLRGKVRTLLRDGNDLLAPDATVGRAIAQFHEANSQLQEACIRFQALAGRSISEHFASHGNALEAIRETGEQIAARHAELNSWCAWRRYRDEAVALELGVFVDALEAGRIPVDEVERTFEAAYCAWWSSMVIGEDEVLRTFSTPLHSATIEKFRELDDHFQKLTADYIAARLSGNVPDPDDIERTSSWGLLRREIQKRSRHKPVRQLVQEIPDVLTTLAPCLMMSPLSVAQYLPADQALFDVVIFDEASQITVWDAVGSLARGKQVIIAGDPKQMPPTNFFARSEDDPDGEVDIEGDLESILDEMIGASIPQCLLNLHYRSRRESLIAFSNSRYYDHSLITFPAPVHPDRAVKLVRCDGFYARGKARHNEGEAKAVVAEILRRLTHPDEQIRSQSIGVVTFNTEQQGLIEDLLDKARSSNPHIEPAFSSEHTLEPVFVKNLETVQGDERDVILFSVTYGPDQSGHVRMNFGPLNRDGGERRLNVAMTRARSEMLVFSTLTPDRIDLSRTSARAVADLKHFLEYAERGPSVLGAAVHGSMGDFDSPFESAVAVALRGKGWTVQPQIGVSAYRIDLGIVHPDYPGRYLAGIECDGTMYHSSAFARERDKIRQAVLEGLGWKILRVWSTDWWTYRLKALDDLHQALTGLLETDRQMPVEESVNEPVQVETARIESLRVSSDERFQSSVLTLDNALLAEKDSTYQVAQLDEERFHPEPDLFYAAEYSARLGEMLDYVIEHEGPVHEEVLVRRIARFHGFKRAGKQIQDIVLAIAKRRKCHSREKAGLFFWPESRFETLHAQARWKERDDEMRKVEYICKEELRAIDKLLETSGDPVELARHLGIARLSQFARERIVEAMGGGGKTL